MHDSKTRTPGFDACPGPVWWTVLDVARARGRNRLFFALWLAVVALSVAAALVSEYLPGLPVHLGTLRGHARFFPPVGISVLAALWMGPAWGVSCAYLSTLATGIQMGVAPGPAAVLAMTTPITVLVLWSSMVMLGVSPSLDTAGDWGRFSGLALLAALASSVGAVLWNFYHGLTLDEARVAWRAWVLMDFLQLTLIVAPVLRFASKPVRRRLADLTPVRPRSALSAYRYATFYLFVFLMIVACWMETERLFVRAPEFASAAGKAGSGSEVNRAMFDALMSFAGVYVATLFALLVVFSVTLGVLMERHRQSAYTDVLTGCLNRRAFAETLAAQTAGPGCVSLLIFDVDRFKAVNDRHGHATGDALLRAMADRIKTLIRRSDCLFRWGGEEFAVLLPGTGLAQAHEVAERIRASLDEDPLATPSGRMQVTVSIGLAYADSGEPPRSLFGRADAACYRAKHNGRNRVEVAAA